MKTLLSSLIFRVLLVLTLFAIPTRAQNAADPDLPPPREVRFPSPDGHFAFLLLRHPDENTIGTFDLIDKATEAVVLHLTDAESDNGQFSNQVFWTPDSKRFALTTRYNHFGQDLTVYQRDGDSFQEIKIELPDTDIPDGRLPKGHQWKPTQMESVETVRWQKDGSLYVKLSSFLQAINSDVSVSAERSAVYKFRPAKFTATSKATPKKIKVHADAN